MSMKPDLCSTILSSLLRQLSLNDLVLEGYHSQSAMSSNISREMGQLLFVQLAICAQSTAHVHRVGLYCRDGFGHVSCVQTTGQEEWHVNCFAYALADGPVVRAPGAAQLLD